MTEKIVVDAGSKKSTISRHIYGHFAEHLGRCIYGGFWVGKDSPVPNIHGYNKAVVQAFKELNIPNLRWPGGCFADEYHWKDGIGPKENRKRMINTNWGGVVEDNSFGTHEFFGLCDELGCQPYICGNVGSGSVQEMDEWIEYMTFDGESPMANLRKANGQEKAWKLPFFGVGNENWGCGGNMRPEFYADLYRRYQTFVRQYGKEKIVKIAGGPNIDDYNWTDVLMKNAHWLMNGLSLHYYTYEYHWGDKRSSTDFDKEGWYRTVKNAYRMEELVRRHGEIMDKYDPEKKVALVVDEWGCWHQCEPGTNPGFLYQQNSVRDAVTGAITLNIFNNHCDRVKMANLAQAVNVLQSPVLTEGDKIVLTPTWHLLHMYKDHQDAELLKTRAACGDCGIQEKDLSVSALSVSASVKHCDKCGKDKYLVTIANADSDSSRQVEISLAHFAGKIDSAEGSLLTGDAMNSINTFDKPDQVTEKAITVEITDRDSVKITLPAYSVAAIKIKA
ncbi:alpha-L-arabinofuranosidase C-terminal domain-containing protein [Treponema sp.]|uniref:alpha-N-arabinofuranosidase n=1 Tax=Treponema sp. TaxID=166 RepID=UPI0025EBACD4|nr:alpha-L-arabinofuranosidase C-terminal domain-containing protein [Treponema sp.]MCR5218202.1 alpha-N-arabinofuranosidase [Treponema sp.]